MSLSGPVRMTRFALAAAVLPLTVSADTWRVGDEQHAFSLHPVSFVLTTGPTFQLRHDWGGSHAAEIVVDDDGDGLIDEDPVERVDNDGDFLWNEDPVDGVDNDLDGLTDEDGPDPQLDNDGDGFLNEDGRHTGGLIRSPALRTAYEATPFFRYATAAEAASDAEGWDSGYGWGDDDVDGRFNEDPVDGRDNDEDGLIDEDGPAPDSAVPGRWIRPVLTYDAAGLSQEQRQALRFVADDGQLAATTATGTLTATIVRAAFEPSDWIQPIRLDSTRNVARLVDDRFLAGLFGEQDPLQLGSQVGTPRFGDSGNGQVVDGNISTAKSVVGGWGFGTELNGLFWLDRIRYYPRPNFNDRTPASFQVSFGGDDPSDFRTSVRGVQLVASRFLIPVQTDQFRPVIKDFRLNPPQKVRLINFGSRVQEGDVWEIAEAEYFGRGFALDASWTSEIIDVGTEQPRVRRYFDDDEPWRSTPIELIRTIDDNNDGSIAPSEEAGARAAAQFDADAPGSPVSWGHVRWHGQVIGSGGGVQIRVRTGSSPDPRLYQRRVGPGVVSSFIEAPILFDWPARGSRLDLHSYLSLSSVARAPYEELPANLFGSQDGAVGGWTPWSAPIDFDEGIVGRDQSGGTLLSLPPLTRYVQFRVDFVSTRDSGVRLDYLEFDYARPLVSRGVLVEVFPDTAGVLGQDVELQYAMRPTFDSFSTSGFNRIDIAVPTAQSRLDSFLLDGALWNAVPDVAPVDPTQASAWLDTLTVAEPNRFAQAVIRGQDGRWRLSIKTPRLTVADFPRGQDREIRLHFRTSLFNVLTRFESWVWQDDDIGSLVSIPQPTSAGNAADDLPGDGVAVVVDQASATLDDVTVTPNPFTPNGDSVNDAADFDFALLLFLEQTKLRIDIMTLSGTPVKQLTAELAAGRHAVSWDGTDDNGNLVAPGVYVYRIEAGGNATRTGTVAVAY